MMAGTYERAPALEGGRNFRDLGGYETRDGRRLRWGRLYRSGSMAGLTEPAYAELAARGVRFVCDLRTRAEREAGPMQWDRVPNLSYWARDYEFSFGDLRGLLASDQPSAEKAQAAMVSGYQQLPFEQAPAYRELFRRLSAGDVPLVFNCSAGKDRTGVAAALVLGALGVPDDIIVEDYLLSNVHYDRTVSSANSLLGRVDQSVIDAILGVHDSYIRAALNAVEAAHGSVEAYLADELGLTRGELGGLREHLLD